MDRGRRVALSTLLLGALIGVALYPLAIRLPLARETRELLVTHWEILWLIGFGSVAVFTWHSSRTRLGRLKESAAIVATTVAIVALYWAPDWLQHDFNLIVTVIILQEWWRRHQKSSRTSRRAKRTR